MTTLTFLDLPGEIRNQIYFQLLIVLPVSVSQLLHHPPIYPQILGVCKKVHEEARRILYSCNTFLAHPNLLSSFPRLRLHYSTISSPTLISLIQRYHIRVRLDCDPNFSLKEANHSFTGIEELTIEVFQAQFGSSDYKVLRLFEGVRGVKRARIYGSVTSFPEYVQWLETAMVTPRDGVVERFDKERAVTSQVRSYDIWTVSGNEE
jgi:hypothetical protein